MGVHDEELEGLAARVHALRAQAGHHDDRKAAHSQYLMIRDEYERSLAEGNATATTPQPANGSTHSDKTQQ